jgi:uncharacterized protein
MMRSHPLQAFFLLVFAITWGIALWIVTLPEQVTALFGEMSVFHPLFVLAVWGPTLAAVIVTLGSKGFTGLGPLFRPLVRWRAHPLWYLFIFLGLPFLGVGAVLLSGNPLQFEVSLPILLNLIYTGPLSEELGWRGFALPRLLARYRALTASLLLGAVWSIWHLPSFFIGGLPQAGAAIPAFLIGGLAISVLATWVYQHTAGSVLLSACLHLAINFALTVLGAPLILYAGLLVLLAMLVVLVDGPVHLSQRVVIVGRERNA